MTRFFHGPRGSRLDARPFTMSTRHAGALLALAGGLLVTACATGEPPAPPSPGSADGAGMIGVAPAPSTPVRRPAPLFRECRQTCSTAADCAEPGASALGDASHFTCTNNRCEYTGCKTSAECTSVHGPRSICEAIPGLPIKGCVATCATPADCAEPGGPALGDASHFLCTGDRCELTGCKTDAECTAVFGPRASCEAIPGASIKDCVATCATRADCSDPEAPPLFDASHFACTAGRCDYLGCKGNAECTAVHGPGWVCE